MEWADVVSLRSPAYQPLYERLALRAATTIPTSNAVTRRTVRAPPTATMPPSKPAADHRRDRPVCSPRGRRDPPPKRSYGVVALRWASGGLEVLLVCRRHSIALCHIIFGRQRVMAPNRLSAACANLTPDERAVLLDGEVGDAVDAIVGSPPDLKLTRQEQRRLRWTKRRVAQRVSTIRQSRDLRRVVRGAACRWDQPEWEFAKGRPNGQTEPAAACGLREFGEETGYDAGDVVLHRPESVRFVERYFGTDGVEYENTYFLGFMRDASKAPSFDPSRNKNQCHEISDVRWFPVAAAAAVIRQTQAPKRTCLDEVIGFVRGMAPEHPPPQGHKAA